MNRISIAKDFSQTPGFRYSSEGPYSGEEFRKTHLVPLFTDKQDNAPIEINLDGVAGYATSFLEEAFGGLAREFGIERCLKRLAFLSEEEPLLPKDIDKYIRESQDK